MSDMVVVYESNEPFWAEELMKALREEGLHPELADDAGTVYYSMDNKNPGVVGMPQGRMKVSVVVPSQEEADARLFLQKRDEQSGSSVTELTGRLRKPLILSALAAVVTFSIMVCLWGWDEPENILGIVLLYVLPVSFILTAYKPLINSIIGQICTLIIIVASLLGAMYCWDKALIYVGCFILCVPVFGVAYIFLRTHKYVSSSKKYDDL